MICAVRRHSATAGDIRRSQLKEEEGCQLVEARGAARNPTSLRALPPLLTPHTETQQRSIQASQWCWG